MHACLHLPTDEETGSTTYIGITLQLLDMKTNPNPSTGTYFGTKYKNYLEGKFCLKNEGCLQNFGGTCIK